MLCGLTINQDSGIKQEETMSNSETLQAEILKAISHPNRILIIDLLRAGPLSVLEISCGIGGKQSNTSRHLITMQHGGILSQQKDGPRVLYSIKYIEVFDIIDLAGRIMAHRITDYRGS